MILAGKTALVTGSAKRIGRELALALSREGVNVIVHCHRSREEGGQVVEEIQGLGVQAWLVQGDLSNPTDIDRILEELEANSPPVSILVNSASVYPETPLATATLDDWNTNLDVNLRAPFLLSSRLGLAMIRNGMDGCILNISDCSTRRPYKGFLPYLVSKAGLDALTEILALELAPHVRVNGIAPGTVLLPEDCPPEREAQALRRRLLEKTGSPSDVTALAIHILRDMDFMTGTTVRVDGGSTIR